MHTLQKARESAESVSNKNQPVPAGNRAETPDSGVFTWHRICSVCVIMEKQGNDCQIRSFGAYGHAARPTSRPRRAGR